MKRLILLCIFLAGSLFMSRAKVQLPPVFADNMVLQQQTDAALWGKAKPDAKVVITPSWSKKKTVVMSDSEGKWSARVATPEAGGPYEITFSDGEKVTLKNVMIGEVWICSGQSNMEMPMMGYRGQPVEGSAEYIVKARPEVPIRTCIVEKNLSFEVNDTCSARWLEHTPDAVAVSSATAYFFAQSLYQALNVPVGIVNVSYGDTPIEGWMDPELLRTEFAGEFDLSHFETKVWPEKNLHKLPGVLYNGMLHSVMPYTAKGFLWYQGCSNRKRFEQYVRLQPAFARMLRRDWDNEQMPFYFVQIAPYRASNPDKKRGGFMMWAQAQTLELIPRSGMVCLHDAGDFYCVHPPKKKVVGDRLSYLALSNDYGIDAVDLKTPIPVKFEFNPGEAVVTFNNCEKRGIGPIWKELEGFELAGEDQVFYPAKATVIINKPRNQISVKCPEVPNPVAVRYGIRNWSVATLFNGSGIPVTPFRSDNWEYRR